MKANIKTTLEGAISENKEFTLLNGGKVSDYLLNKIQNSENGYLKYLTEEERKVYENGNSSEQLELESKIEDFIIDNYDYYLYPSSESEIAKDTYLVATFYHECTMRGSYGHQNCTYSCDIVKGIDKAIDRLIKLAEEEDNITSYTSLKEIRELKNTYEEEREEELNLWQEENGDMEDEEIAEFDYEIEIPEWVLNYQEGDKVLINESSLIYNSGDERKIAGANLSVDTGDYTISIIPLDEVKESVNLKPNSDKQRLGAVTEEEFFQELKLV